MQNHGYYCTEMLKELTLDKVISLAQSLERAEKGKLRTYIPTGTAPELHKVSHRADQGR